MLLFSDYLKQTSKNNNNLLIIFGAGIVGRLTLEALNQRNINVDYFCDSDPRKQKLKINSIIVWIIYKLLYYL